MVRSSVDLPQPEGPTNTTNSPSAISRLMPCSTGTAPKLLLIPRSLSSAISSLLQFVCADGLGHLARRSGTARPRPHLVSHQN
ncbi:hypothetical protein D3C72_1591290 [compost metagenome]